MNGADRTTDTWHLLRKQGVGGREEFKEALLWGRVEDSLLQILIEVAFIQVYILGADEE